MATTAEYMEYVCGQLAGAGALRYRKMFGEYMLYVNDKPVLTVCDSTVYVKKLDCLSGYGLPTGCPYEGAKEHYILDIDDGAGSREIVEKAEAATPLPKPRRKKNCDEKEKN